MRPILMIWNLMALLCPVLSMYGQTPELTLCDSAAIGLNVNKSISANCQLTLDPSFIVRYKLFDDDEYCFTVINENGDTLDQPLGGQDVGQTLEIVFTFKDTCKERFGTSYLTLEDKIDPEIYCNSEEDTVTCFDIQFQFPEYFDCQPDEIKIVAQTFDSICMDSLIYRVTRTYRVTDLWGNDSECTEEYVVKRININQTVFPEDMVISCDTIDNFLDKNGNLMAPKLDLPMGIDSQRTIYPFGVPTFSGASLYGPNLVDCNVRAYYEDLGPINTGCHRRFMRQWKVYEWYCNEEVELAGPLQIIEVVDTIAPEFQFTQDTVYYNVDADSCLVDIPLSTLPFTGPTDNCTSTDELIVDIAVFFNGNYDSLSDTIKRVSLDTLELRIQISDKCHQNTTKDTITIIVRDSIPPIPVMMDSMQITLTDTLTKVDADAFNVGSLDWCGGPLDFNIRRMEDENYTDSVAVTCQDSFLMVVVQVSDQFGNSGIAMVDVEVRDDLNLCPATASGSSIISGFVSYEDGTPMAHIPVYASGSDNAEVVSDEQGYFEFPELNSTSNVTIAPVKDDNHTAGISTFDIILMQRHLLGLENLDSPYKVIAADVNGNGKINASDIFQLRKLILADTDKFSENTSYVFVPSSMEFRDPIDPWDNGDIFNAHIYSSIPTGPIELMGIKVGDVNKSSLHASGRGYVPSQKWRTEMARNGDIVEYFFYSDYPIDLAGFQSTFQFKEDVLNFIQFRSGAIEIANDHYTTAYSGEGLLPVSWNTAIPIEVDHDDVLFSIVLSAHDDSSPGLNLSTWPVRPEAYSSTGTYDIELLETESITESMAITEIAPNPWNSETRIEFYASENGRVDIQIMDVSGQIIVDKTYEADTGFNSFLLNHTSIPGSGMYYVRLSNGTKSHMKKMIFLSD